MPDFDFRNEALKKAINLVKTVKPVTDDISFSFGSHGLTLFSYDQRRSMLVNLASSTSKVESDFSSDEFYIFADKTAAFNSDLDEVSIKVNDGSLSIITKGDGQSRKFSLKKRSVKSKRPPVPSIPDIEFTEILRKDFEAMIRSASCSAGVKESKTDAEMRVMQVHFYESGHAVSSTRFHGSLVKHEDVKINTSIVSSDIPFIRSFCSKVDGEFVKFGQDENKIYFLDGVSGSFLTVSKIDTKKPPLQIIPNDGFSQEVRINQSKLLQNLKWAALVIERTQRVTFSFTKDDDDDNDNNGDNDNDNGKLALSFSQQEAEGLPVTFIKGNNFSLDIPINVFMHIVTFLEGDVVFRYGHNDNSYASVIEVSSYIKEKEDSEPRKMQDCHYLTSMRVYAS